MKLLGELLLREAKSFAFVGDFVSQIHKTFSCCGFIIVTSPRGLKQRVTKVMLTAVARYDTIESLGPFYLE